MTDPRFMMAKVYRHHGLTEEMKEEFTQEINECDSPEAALALAEEYILMGDEILEELADGAMGDLTYGFGGRN